MKNSFLSFLLLFAISASVYGQKFAQVTSDNAGKLVTLSQDQVLEVKLTSIPSSGYGWYLKNPTRQNIVKQVGDWEFVSDNTADAVGSSGTQITRFVGAANGTADLELVYIRPWETDVEPLDSYKITVSSAGAYTGNYRAPEPAPVEEYVPTAVGLALPSAYNLQAQCSPVKNQGSCGSCWAYATCGSFEAVINMKDRVIRDLSEQWMVNCDKKSLGCKGGYCPNYMLLNGAVYEADVPYKGADGTCAASYTKHEKIESHKQVAYNTDAIKQAIYNYGPIWATVYVGSKFQGYKSGVLTVGDQGTNNHAIVLCGWDDATSSWVLRNSWAASWGDKGYMKIKYGVCNVGQVPTYLVYKGGFLSVDKDFTNSTLEIYPNPAANGIFSFSGLERENTIEIYDVVGKLVHKLQTTTANSTVDLSSNQKGVYFYRVTNSNKAVKQGKVVIM